MSAVSLVWNFESGIACTVSFCVYSIVLAFQERMNFAKFCKIILSALIFIVASIAVSVLFIDVYNIAAGGELITLKGYLFPYMASGYIQELNVEIIKLPSMWMLTLIIVISFAVYIISNTGLCKVYEKNKKHALYASAIIMTAILLIYYINRSGYGNLYIIVPNMCLTLMFIFNESNNDSQKVCNFSSCIKRIIAMLVVVLFVTAGEKYLWSEHVKLHNDSRNMKSYEIFREEFRKKIPKDTFCIGQASSALYSDLGWDNGYYALDFADILFMSAEGVYELKNRILNSEKIVVTDRVLIWIEDMGIMNDFLSNHEAENEILYDDFKMIYYVKK